MKEEVKRVDGVVVAEAIGHGLVTTGSFLTDAVKSKQYMRAVTHPVVVEHGETDSMKAAVIAPADV